MGKKKVHKIIPAGHSEFLVLGVASHEKSFVLSHALNTSCGTRFERKDPLVFSRPANEPDIVFDVFVHQSEKEPEKLILLSNHGGDGYFLNQFRYLDYFILWPGNPNQNLVGEFLDKVKKSPPVLTVTLPDLSRKIKDLFIPYTENEWT